MTAPNQIGIKGDKAHVEGGIHYNIYQRVQPQQFDEATLKHAQQKLSEVPVDFVPDPAPLPMGSRIAFKHNPLFIGREQDLKSLASLLKGGQSVAIGQTVAATGLGGIGKTQLASEFVHRYGQYFAGGVYWLNFGDPQAVPAEVAACSTLIEEGFELETQIKLVLSAWQSALPRLLVFDNCEDEKLLADWCPPTGGSRVLATSRRQSWDSSLSVETLSLGVLARKESIAFLQKLSDKIIENEASAIAQELGDLPLALHLAGSFLNRYEDVVSPSQYLQQLQDKTLLDHESLEGRGTSLSPTDHKLHVARTFALSYDKLDDSDEIDQTAIALLCRAAAFAPGTPIAKDLLFKTLNASNEGIDPLKTVDGLERLLGLGLIEAESKETLVLHRLLRVYVSTLSADENAQLDVETVLFNEALTINKSRYPKDLIEWQPHLMAITERAKDREDEHGANLCNELGYHLQAIGDYTAARPYIEKALEIRTNVLGEEHPETTVSLNNLGYLLRFMGDYTAARLYYEKALKIRINVLGEEHPETALSLNNLGYLLKSIGDYTAAQPYFEKALKIRINVLGEEHPKTAISLSNLGNLLHDMCDYTAARLYYEKALKIRLKVLGEEHYDTAMSLNNLGSLLHDMGGDYAAARPYFEKALEIRTNVLGEKHPETAISLNNLGNLLLSMGDYTAARPYIDKALEIRLNELGEEHPDTAGSIYSLGCLHQAMGDHTAARPYYEKALEIFKNVLGEEHPNTRRVESNLNIFTAGKKRSKRKTGRNEPCPCGSGKKFKKCCLT